MTTVDGLRLFYKHGDRCMCEAHMTGFSAEE